MSEEHRLRNAGEGMRADPSYFSFDHEHLSHFSRGPYSGQLMNWHSLFGQEQVLMLASARSFKCTQETLDLVLDTRGLPGYEFDQAKPKSLNRHGPMNPDIRRWPEELFEPHDQKLYEYLRVDLGW